MKKVSPHPQLPQLFLLSIVGMLAVPLTLTAQEPANPNPATAADADTEITIDESADTPAAPARRSGARGAYTDAVNAPVAPVTIRNYRAPIKPAPAHPPLPVSADPGARLQVTRVNFTGNSVFSQATLAAIVSDRLGQSLSFQELLDLAARVENFYHRHGYQITRVIIPQQDARDTGVLEFQVLEGRLGKINVSGNRRYPTERVLAALEHSVTVGEPFTITDLERPLVHLNDAAGLGADATLKPGEAAGTTDLDVLITERRRIGGSLEFNNFGSKDYSEWRAIPGLSLPNLTGVGDELSALGVLAMDNIDSWFYQVEYRRPLNTFGTSLLLYFGQGRNVVGNEFDILDIKGDNLAWGAGLSHHFVFSPRSSLKLNGWFEWADLEQTMLGFTTSDDNIRKIRLGADYELKDSLGRTFVSLYLHQGLGHNLGGMPDGHQLSSRAYSGADDNFSKFTLGLMRLQSFHPQLYGLININAQYTLDPLVAGEQLYLGGANSVRGQPASAFSGDDGVVVNAELRFAVLADRPSLLQLAAFFDHGEVFLRHPIIGQEKRRGISGTGAGVRSQIFTGLDARFDVAFPVGAQRGDDMYFYGQLRYSF